MAEEAEDVALDICVQALAHNTLVSDDDDSLKQPMLTQSLQEMGLVLARRGERQSAATGGATGGRAEEESGTLAPFLVRVLRRVRAQLNEPGAPPPSLTMQNGVQVTSALFYPARVCRLRFELALNEPCDSPNEPQARPPGGFPISTQ